MRPSSLRIATLALSVVGTTCGCGSGATASPNATQVVARIDGHELTISQLNQALVAMHAADTGPAAQQQALNALIDEELVVQAAQKATLDRDRGVMISMDADSREILVRAYAEQHIYPSGPIEDSELHRFYDANPALFSARNIYHAVAFNVEQGPLAPELQAEIDQARSVDALRAILSRKNIGFQTEEITRAAEAIPLPLLPKLAAAAAGRYRDRKVRGRSNAAVCAHRSGEQSPQLRSGQQRDQTVFDHAAEQGGAQDLSAAAAGRVQD
jgi:peptidyl-prolyl cis-trans isomerase C